MALGGSTASSTATATTPDPAYSSEADSPRTPLSLSRKNTPISLIHRRVVATKLDSATLSLGDFEPRQTLGTGTFGRVRLVRFKPEKAPAKSFFALKIMRKADIVRLKQVEHILSEARLLSELVHPFIVNMCASFQDDTRLYMLLEYVQGGELFSHLRKERRLKDDAARFYASEIILALDYLHARNIVYRDLKPENVLITRLGTLKIADFGFAKLLERGRTYTVCGTPEYLSPEIIQNKGHGLSTDWWSLGVLVYEMLAGFPPFSDESPLVTYELIKNGRVEYPAFFDSKAKSFVSKLLVVDVSKRLGCLREGAQDVMRHRWFSKTDWQGVLDRLVTPPHFPTVKDFGDASNFDAYAEQDDAPPLVVPPDVDARFREFGPFVGGRGSGSGGGGGGGASPPTSPATPPRPVLVPAASASASALSGGAGSPVR